MFLLPGKVWTQLWNSLFSRQRWLSPISNLICRVWRYFSFPPWCWSCQSWSCCYRRSLTPVTNLWKDKRQLLKQLLVRPFDTEDIYRLDIIISPFHFIRIHSYYIEPVLHPGGSESINLGLVQELGALSLHGVRFICVCNKIFFVSPMT